MTIFSVNPHDRRMERLMMTVPNFAPRGVGFRFTEAQLFIATTVATPTEILTATMRQIRCPPFRKRFNEYIESEEKPMAYLNEKHRARFTLVAKNVHRENYALLSALYGQRCRRSGGEQENIRQALYTGHQARNPRSRFQRLERGSAGSRRQCSAHPCGVFFAPGRKRGR